MKSARLCNRMLLIKGGVIEVWFLKRKARLPDFFIYLKGSTNKRTRSPVICFLGIILEAHFLKKNGSTKVQYLVWTWDSNKVECGHLKK